MTSQTVRRVAIGLLNRELDDTLDLRRHAMHARWCSRASDTLSLPRAFDQLLALTQALMDPLAERVMELGGVPLAAPRERSRLPRLTEGTRPACEHVQSLMRSVAILGRLTRPRVDLALSLGDGRSAHLLAQTRRTLEAAMWQLDAFAGVED